MSLVKKLRGIRNRAPVPFTSQHGPQSLVGMMSRTDQMSLEAQMRSYGSVGILFMIVNRLANTTAQAEWHLHRKVANKSVTCDLCDVKGVVNVESHPALDAWNSPNKFYTGQDFREASQQHLELVGETVWGVSYFAGTKVVDEVWTIRPDRIAPIEDKDVFIREWEYTAPDGKKIALQNDEVIQIKMPNPMDMYRGLGPVQALLVDLDSARYTMDWNRRFFLNSAEPGGVLSVEGNLLDHEFNQMRERWDEQHKGIRNSHRVALIENGAKWIPRTFSMRDMQFRELRELSTDLIMQGFGFPKPLAGIVQDVNRASAEAMDDIFAKWLVIPRLRRMKQTLDHKFLPLFGNVGDNKYSFMHSDPTPPNLEAEDRERNSKATAYSTYVAAGVEPEDAAQVTGLPTMRHKIVVAEPQPKKSDFAPAARLEITTGTIGDIVNRKKGDPDPDEELKEAWEAELDNLLYKWAGVIEDQTQELYMQIREAVDDGNLSLLADLQVDTKRATSLLTRALMRMANEGAENMQRQAKEAGKEVELVVPTEKELRQIAEVRSQLLAKSLADAAAKEALRVNGRRSTGQQVADAVEEHIFELSDTYLRDQLGGALWSAENAGKADTIAQAEPAGFVANESRDKNTCGPCKRVNGKRFKNLETVMKSYPNGGYHKCEGGIRCRGTFDPIWK